MNIYDKAHDLSRTLKGTAEYVALLSAQEKLKAEPAAFKMFLDYRRKEIVYQGAVMSGQQPPDEDLKTLEQLSQIISLNTVVRDYIQAEARFGVVFGDIQRILSEAVKELSSMYQDEEEGGK